MVQGHPRAELLQLQKGFKHGKLHRLPRCENTAARRLQKDIYVLQLDAVLKRGDILLFTDESYVNVRLGFQYSYEPADSMFATWTPKGNGLGQRLLIIHMLGNEGLLVSKNVDGSVCSPGLGAGTPEKPTVKMIICATKDGSQGVSPATLTRRCFCAGRARTCSPC